MVVFAAVRHLFYSTGQGQLAISPPTPKIILVNGTVWYSQAYSCPSGFSLLPESKTQRFCGLFLNYWKTEGMKKALQAV